VKYLILCAGFIIASYGFVFAESTYNKSFDNDLSIGASGTLVADLQNWLIAHNFDIPAISTGKIPAGYFGAQTQKALIVYQKSVGLPAYGFFGPLTRKKINNLVIQSNDPKRQTDFTIVSPNSGSVVYKNDEINIAWTSSTTQSDSYTLRFMPDYCKDALTNSSSDSCILPPGNIEYIIAENINKNTTNHKWKVGDYLYAKSSANMSLGLIAPIEDGDYVLSLCGQSTAQCYKSIKIKIKSK
jgi:peptidoglycan hydrolase-like protein with peptidoglycan-binding domain